MLFYHGTKILANKFIHLYVLHELTNGIKSLTPHSGLVSSYVFFGKDDEITHSQLIFNIRDYYINVQLFASQ